MKLTKGERARYSKEIEKMELRPVKGTWLYEHFLETLWWRERNVPTSCQVEYTYKLLRKLEAKP